ncbi:hypothetical protein [Streptomyces sp. S.PNR 29]|uniref:hypothetical protein n=1 Tax=Streptomyces sp. S.PNR 29 TaxID=2973805 RepID=UPI0025B21493|nr:hypothetical protein [Streptomyces sp. S.PNR 29]MDN0200455.1 hypothetical protein [Streptomyces sp. S.PNR 29]
MAARSVRVRLDGATESDVGALHKWLEREKPLDELVRAGKLQIHERPRTDADETGTPMGVDLEIVVTVLETTVLLVEVVDLVRRAVDAWKRNRSQVEDGAPPQVSVDREGPAEPVVPEDRAAPEGREDPEPGQADRRDTDDGDPPVARAEG